MLTPIGYCKVQPPCLVFGRAQQADSSRPTPARWVNAKRRRLYDLAEGPFPGQRFPECSLNESAVTEYLYRTMHKRPAPNKHAKRRACPAASKPLLLASKLPGEDKFLAHPTVAQHDVCIWRHGCRDRPEKGVL
jgi:hypothetical protein